MERKMSTDDVKSLLNHVIRTIDQWWAETENLIQGDLIRSNIDDSPVTYRDYVEWRYSVSAYCKDYVSIFISLEYEDGTDYIRIKLKKLKDEVYTEYEPFCEIHDGLWNVTISDDTGRRDEWFSIFGKDRFNDLTDNIAVTVNRFMDQPSDEEKSDVNMDDVSKTLSVHDIQDCMIKAMRIMLIDPCTVNELTRLGAKYVPDVHGLLQCKNKFGYAIDVTPKHIVAQIVYSNTYTFKLCSFTCEPDANGQHEFIIRYNSCDTGFQIEQGFIILYKDPDGRCFEYTADGLNTEKIFKPFVNVLRNTLNYDMYQQLTKSKEEEAKKQRQEKIAELLEKTCTELNHRKDVMTFWTQRHEFASVVESIISETLDQFCSPEYDRQHELFHQYVRYLMRNKTIDPNSIDHSRYSYRLAIGNNNASLKFDIVADGEITRWYSFETSPVMIASIVVESHDCKSPLGYCDTTDIILESHVDGNKEPKEVTTICQLQRGDDGAIQLIRCFDPVTTCGPCICEKLFLTFHAVIGNSVASPTLMQETCEESKEETMDTETKASAIKPGLTTKETFVLDRDYFKIGDIYLLHIHPEFHGEVNMIYTGTTTVTATLPKWTYAICSDVCDTVIDFTFKRADKDDLVYIQIHAEDIEKGLIEVTRQLCNETLIQDNKEK